MLYFIRLGSNTAVASRRRFLSSMAHSSMFKGSALFNVEGLVAVVTGGATGIGLMAAQALANNGARVYIASRREPKLDAAVSMYGKSLAHPKGELIPVQADINTKDAIKAFAEHISSLENHIDILVNNAGISKGTSNMEKGDESARALAEELWAEDQKEWEDVYRTNVIGHFFTAVAFLPLLSAASHMQKNRLASVINISSISGITRTTQNHFKYNVSKAGMIHLNTLLAQEFRRNGVKVAVNSIAPGIFPSEMTAGQSDDKNKSMLEKDMASQMRIPAGRAGNDEDMAQAVLFLACNQYVFGQTIVVDGGYLLEHP